MSRVGDSGLLIQCTTALEGHRTALWQSTRVLRQLPTQTAERAPLT